MRHSSLLNEDVKKGQNLGVPKEDRSDQSKETSLENENSSESSRRRLYSKNIIIERKREKQYVKNQFLILYL